jgi:hypothetical protein
VSNPHVSLDPDMLDVTAVDRAYAEGFADGWESTRTTPRRDRSALVAIIAAGLAVLLAGIVIGRTAFAAPRSAQPVIPAAAIEAGASGNPAGQIGAPPMSGDGSRGPASQRLKSAGPGGAPFPSPPAQPINRTPAATSDIGTAIESGVIAYAEPSFGDRYLALPEGPGHRLTICVGRRCLERVSTDAGPDLSMQRAGRIADVSFVDFAWLCRCDPAVRGTAVATIERFGPGLTAPPTDVSRGTPAP